MAGLYDDFRADALELIKEFGQVGKLIHLEAGTYDPATGAEADKTETEHVVTFAAFSYSSREISDSRYQKGTQIQAGDKKALMAVEGAIPQMGDKLIVGGYGRITGWPLLSQMGPIGYDGGHPWRVMGVKILNPGGIDVMYTLHVRR